jgi:hypothetical protein
MSLTMLFVAYAVQVVSHGIVLELAMEAGAYLV